MSRSGYSDNIEDQWAAIRWRGAVASAIRGARGQAFLAEMVTALDAMPVKELHAEILVQDGCVCAMGAVAVARGIDASEIDAEDDEAVTKLFGLSNALVREVAYENDEGSWWGNETPAARWGRMRTWANSQIKGASK